MKTAKPSAPTIGRRLRRTLGALLAIGFATTWWKFVPTRESAAAPLEKPPATVAESTSSPVIVIPIPIVLPFTLPTAPTSPTLKPVQARHRPRVVHTQVAVIPTHQPFAVPPPDYVPPVPESDPIPVVDPTPDPTPVVEVPPTIVDDPPEQPPTDKPPTKNPEPRIRTRSS